MDPTGVVRSSGPRQAAVQLVTLVPGRRGIDFDRQPLLYFHTSSFEKWLQARVIGDEVGISVSQFYAGSEPYDEDYSLEPQDMLAASLDQAVAAAGKHALVFVEDTTVRIPSLSTSGAPFPGLKTKEWFAETTFEELDGALGDSREAVVRSDITLYIPGLRRHVYVHGETVGSVTRKPPPSRTHPLYRWLTTETFSGWFIPSGAAKPLGLMEFEESRKYDFREVALLRLFERVQEYTAALNLPAQAYRRRRSRSRSGVEDILPFPDASALTERAQIIVIGRTCAGKSTFATEATSRYRISKIEASDELRSIDFDRTQAPDPVRDPAGYAMALLETLGMGAVAEHILRTRDVLPTESFVISGLRTIEEIALLRRAVPSLRIVLVEAPFTMRYERYLRRKRSESETLSKDEFAELDAMQAKFGLLPVARDIADDTINNVASLEEYLATVDTLIASERDKSLKDPPEPTDGEHRASPGRVTRLSRALKLLQHAGPLSLKEIEKQTGLGEHNASRILGFAPNTTQRRIVGRSRREEWKITPAGLAYLELLAQANPRGPASHGEP